MGPGHLRQRYRHPHLEQVCSKTQNDAVYRIHYSIQGCALPPCVPASARSETATARGEAGGSWLGQDHQRPQTCIHGAKVAHPEVRHTPQDHEEGLSEQKKSRS